MGLRALIDQLLSRSARPTKPARSTFGPEADREIADRSKAQEYELEVEKQRSRLRGSS